MNNHSILKLFFIILVVLISLSLGFIYFYSGNAVKGNPYQVLTPENYEKGTKIALYKEAPPDFPSEVLLEGKTLEHSGSVISPQGKIQMSVSYISDKKTEDIIALYEKSLPTVGWTISTESINYWASTIEAIKNNESILLTIVPRGDNGVAVTFQYEK